MTDQTVTSEAGGDLRLAAILAYGLYLAAIFNGVTAIAGLVVAYVKRGDARGTPYESHFDNLIGLFWTSLVLFTLLTAAVLWGVLDAAFAVPDGDPVRLLLVLPLAGFACVALFVWYLYRSVKGILRAIDGRAYR